MNSPKHEALRNRLFKGLDAAKIHGGAEPINSTGIGEQDARNQDLADKQSDLAPNPKQMAMVRGAGGSIDGQPSHEMDVKGIEVMNPPNHHVKPVGVKHNFHEAMQAEMHGTVPGSLRDKVKQHMSKMK